MLLKCLLFTTLVLSLEAASITKQIPVNVVYDYSENVQGNDREKPHTRNLQNENLAEKVQLSGRELKDVDLHIPEQVEKDGKLFVKAKTVFLEKLNNFKDQVDGFSVKTSLKKPTTADWNILNEKVQEIFRKYEKTGIRQNQGGFFSELQQATTQWFQSFGGNNNKPAGEEDEQPQNQGGFGQIWNNFQNGVTQAFNNLSNNNNQEATTSNTVLGDTGVTSTTNAPGFFQNIVSNIFNNNNNQANKPGQESDTEVTSPPNIFQGAINNIINTFSPSSEKPSNSQGDTGASSTAAPGNQFFQNFNNAIGQVFGGTKPPGASGDNEATSKPTSFFENVNNAFQNVFNQNQASSTVNAQGDGSTPATNIINQGLQQIQIPGQNGGDNNVQQFQNTGQQIVQGFQNPQNFAQNIGQQISGGSQNIQNPQNFVNQAQNIGQQFSENNSQNNQIQQLTEGFQNPQNFLSQAQNIGQQFNGNSSQNNQIQQLTEGFQNPQNFLSQAQNIGQQFNGNSSQSNTGQAIGQQINQVFQNPQNFASQAQNIGQQFSENIPSLPQNGQDSNSQSSVSNLNINQIPVIGQQINQNANPIQNFQSNIVNQIQNSSNQIQNPGASSYNPINLIDNQNQQVNVNQLNQIIPANSQSQASNGIQSITNQFNNGFSQLGNQNGTNNFVATLSNPLNAAQGIVQSNQSQNTEQNNQINNSKPVTEEKVERKGL